MIKWRETIYLVQSRLLKRPPRNRDPHDVLDVYYRQIGLHLPGVGLLQTVVVSRPKAFVRAYGVHGASRHRYTNMAGEIYAAVSVETPSTLAKSWPISKRKRLRLSL